MAKSDLYSNSLLPAVLVAGILSGSLWRTTPSSGTGKPDEPAAMSQKTEGAEVAAPWISDLRPVMDSIADTLGVGATSSDAAVLSRAGAIALEKNLATRDNQVLSAMSRLRAGLDGTDRQPVCVAGDPTLATDAATIGAWLMADDGSAETLRIKTARALLDEYHDWRLMARLVEHVARGHGGRPPAYALRFIVATIPDYVDSNSGWQADQNLAAIQSGMTRRGYVFDRIRLIDWSRSLANSTTPAASSRLHERQPGAAIFRQVDGDTVWLQVVLLVLETPTAGVHQTALRNSLSFMRAWNACAGGPQPPLRVLGPTFSGSTISLASVLSEPENRDAFSMRLVITGSANADSNVDQMAEFGRDIYFRSTVQPTSILRERAAALLTSMNPEWTGGQHVALLTESNTAYGRSARKDITIDTDPLSQATTFYFPLHVAQLRSDAPVAATSGASLLPTAIVPLDMREAAPPTDLIPALRPQLTSPVVEATVDSILDAIRHEHFTAVGIFATDDRDTLFLAREVKRASPDVQLLLFGTHALYLHPEYVPYLRGTIVASPYSLSLANQPETGDPRLRTQREPFQSMSAEGISSAMQALLGDYRYETGSVGAANRVTVPYCGDGTWNNGTPCVNVSPATVSVIGEDGYWMLPSAFVASPAESNDGGEGNGSASARLSIPAPPEPRAYPLPPLPIRAILGAGLVDLLVLTHLLILFKVRRELPRRQLGSAFLDLPVVRVLVPPQGGPTAIGFHKFALATCTVLLALIAAWVAAITLPFLAPIGRSNTIVPPIVALIFAGVTAAGFVALYRPSGAVAPTAAETHAPPDSRRSPRPLAWYTGWLLFCGVVATLALLAWVTIQLLERGAGAHGESIVLARVVGGGIVSPAALTLSLTAAIYSALLIGIRRLSLVGKGYATLSHGSPTFALLTGSKGEQQAEASAFAALLDMPSQNLPTIYPLAILLALTVAWIGTRHISAIDGVVFAWFIRIGSLTVLSLGLMQLAQALGTWHAVKPCLSALSRTRVATHFQKIAQHGSWDITLAPPRVSDLLPVARMADSAIHDFPGLSLDTPYARAYDCARRELGPHLPSINGSTARGGIRGNDVVELANTLPPYGYSERLSDEVALAPSTPIIASESWRQLWTLSDAIVTAMNRTSWRRATPTRPAVAGIASVEGDGESGVDAWFTRCERLVALQVAFTLRDVVARTITSLFAAMLCLTLLTASHLFYTFNGRTSTLTIDLFAVGAASLASVWILIGMERDEVLSSLRCSTPGRVDINWEFIKRLGVYGVLPLIAVIASVFPEIGGTLFGWLEPLRKLSSF